MSTETKYEINCVGCGRTWLVPLSKISELKWEWELVPSNDSDLLIHLCPECAKARNEIK